LYSSVDQEQANYMGQNNSYSNTYNPGWRNHTNFSWNNNQNALNLQGQQRNFQQAAQPVYESKKSDIESIVRQLATQQQQMMTYQDQLMFEEK
jgi:hypothetical protein